MRTLSASAVHTDVSTHKRAGFHKRIRSDIVHLARGRAEPGAPCCVRTAVNPHNPKTSRDLAEDRERRTIVRKAHRRMLIRDRSKRRAESNRRWSYLNYRKELRAKFSRSE
jgi:hypothetical protein